MVISAIHWPAVLKLQDSAELIYLALESDLLDEISILDACDEDDLLIDSSGKQFRITSLLNSQQELSTAGNVTVSAFIGMLQQHINAIGHCCAVKVGCQSVAEGIQLVGKMEME